MRTGFPFLTALVVVDSTLGHQDFPEHTLRFPLQAPVSCDAEFSFPGPMYFLIAFVRLDMLHLYDKFLGDLPKDRETFGKVPHPSQQVLQCRSRILNVRISVIGAPWYIPVVKKGLGEDPSR